MSTKHQGYDRRRVFLFFDSVCDCTDMFEYEVMETRWCGCVDSEAVYCLGCGEQLGIAESDPCDCRQSDEWCGGEL